MAFTHVSASDGARTQDALSADNAHPERHIVIDTLRKAASLMGLKAPVIATLDAMMSCLPPKRHHNTVFASNATLAFRRNGISDRTIRRHAAILQELGLLTRRDSANGKRFSRKNTAEGIALRFGFDLSPLFHRFAEIAALAAEALRHDEQLAYLRAKIRAAANDILRTDPDHLVATDTLRLLRRKLSQTECLELLETLDVQTVEAEQPADILPVEKKEMSANDGQNVRHHHNSNKEHIDYSKNRNAESPDNRPLSVGEILEACPEARQFSSQPVTTMQDVVSHARTLAPMLGIDAKNYQAAQENLGAEGTALTVWAIMQFHEKINAVGAYFRSITSGKNSTGFAPERLVRRLACVGTGAL
ncbi:plasmid replication protein RepC (plasmid) [Marinovum sp. KMM 9989]